MNTVKMQIQVEDVDQIKDRHLWQALLDAGMCDEEDECDPTIGHAGAWDLVRRMTRRIGQGVILSLIVTDAYNGYGRMESWSAIYQEFTETCERCESDPNHYGRHRWRREWVRKLSGNGFSAELAICRLALKYALEVQEYDE